MCDGDRAVNSHVEDGYLILWGNISRVAFPGLLGDPLFNLRMGSKCRRHNVGCPRQQQNNTARINIWFENAPLMDGRMDERMGGDKGQVQGIGIGATKGTYSSWIVMYCLLIK